MKEDTNTLIIQDKLQEAFTLIEIFLEKNMNNFHECSEFVEELLNAELNKLRVEVTHLHIRSHIHGYNNFFERLQRLYPDLDNAQIRNLKIADIKQRIKEDDSLRDTRTNAQQTRMDA